MDSVKTDAKWKLVPVEPTPEMIEAGDVANPTAWNEDTDLGFGCDVAFEVYRAMLAASPPAGAEVVAYLIERHEGVKGYGRPKTVLLANDPYDPTSDDFWMPGAKQNHTITPLYAHPPTPSTDAVRRQARKEALEEAALAFDKTADACAAYTRTLRTGSDAWKLWVTSESENRRAARAVRALSTPPAGAGALNEGEKP